MPEKHLNCIHKLAIHGYMSCLSMTKFGFFPVMDTRDWRAGSARF